MCCLRALPFIKLRSAARHLRVIPLQRCPGSTARVSVQGCWSAPLPGRLAAVWAACSCWAPALRLPHRMRPAQSLGGSGWRRALHRPGTWGGAEEGTRGLACLVSGENSAIRNVAGWLLCLCPKLPPLHALQTFLPQAICFTHLLNLPLTPVCGARCWRRRLTAHTPTAASATTPSTAAHEGNNSADHAKANCWARHHQASHPYRLYREACTQTGQPAATPMHLRCRSQRWRPR